MPVFLSPKTNGGSAYVERPLVTAKGQEICTRRSLALRSSGIGVQSRKGYPSLVKTGFAQDIHGRGVEFLVWSELPVHIAVLRLLCTLALTSLGQISVVAFLGLV